MQRQLLEFGRRTSVGRAECGAEMAVAGKAEIKAESGQVIILRERVQRPCKPESQLITIQWEPFHLLEHLREINWGTAHFRCDFSKCPASRQIAGQHKFHPIDQPLSANAGAGCVGGARTERTPNEG